MKVKAQNGTTYNLAEVILRGTTLTGVLQEDYPLNHVTLGTYNTQERAIRAFAEVSCASCQNSNNDYFEIPHK